MSLIESLSKDTLSKNNRKMEDTSKLFFEELSEKFIVQLLLSSCYSGYFFNDQFFSLNNNDFQELYEQLKKESYVFHLVPIYEM